MVRDSFLFYRHGNFFTKKDNKKHLSLTGRVNGKDELLKSLSKSLLFPSYFGYNWDALCDCLNDFSWINKNHIVLIHDFFPVLPQKELDIYLDILEESVDFWRFHSEHTFLVYFNEVDINKMQRLSAAFRFPHDTSE